MSDKVKPVCGVCGSDDITLDGFATWNTEKQEWVLSQTYEDNFWCNKCDDGLRGKEVIEVSV